MKVKIFMNSNIKEIEEEINLFIKGKAQILATQSTMPNSEIVICIFYYD